MQERSARTRERIVIATAQAINDRSYDQASPARIAANAGVTTGAFYFHFRSKEQAALAVMKVQDSYSQAKASEISVRNEAALDLMLETSAVIMSDIVQDPIVRAGVRLEAEIGLLDAFPIRVWQTWIENNAKQLNDALDEGALHPDINVRGSSEMIVGSIIGGFLLCSLEREMSSLLHRSHLMWQQFIRAYTTDPQRWLSSAKRLFDISPLKPLTFTQVQHRHSEGIAREMEISADEPGLARGK